MRSQDDGEYHLEYDWVLANDSSVKIVGKQEGVGAPLPDVVETASRRAYALLYERVDQDRTTNRQDADFYSAESDLEGFGFHFLDSGDESSLSSAMAA